MTHLTLDAVTPGSEPDLAGRALEAAADQVRLDGGFVSPYDEHSGAPASSGRALSRSVERFGEGALARSGRAHAGVRAPTRQTQAPLTLMLSDGGAAKSVTNSCSRTAAANSSIVLNERVAQQPIIDSDPCF